MESIKELRSRKKLTQQQAAEIVGISVRSFKTYENEARKIGSVKYEYILTKLAAINPINEEQGILSVDDIREVCAKVFSNYQVEFCFLFGSYAKGKATERSDVDLLISTEAKGLRFYGLVEELRAALCKRVDVLDVNQLQGNLELTREVLREGVKIYG